MFGEVFYPPEKLLIQLHAVCWWMVCGEGAEGQHCCGYLYLFQSICHAQTALLLLQAPPAIPPNGTFTQQPSQGSSLITFKVTQAQCLPTMFLSLQHLHCRDAMTPLSQFQLNMTKHYWGFAIPFFIFLVFWYFGYTDCILKRENQQNLSRQKNCNLIESVCHSKPGSSKISQLAAKFSHCGLCWV